MSTKTVTLVVDVALTNGGATSAEASSNGGPWAYSDVPQVFTKGEDWRPANAYEAGEAGSFIDNNLSRKALLQRQAIERRLEWLETKVLEAADLAVEALRSHLDPNDAPHPGRDQEAVALLRTITGAIRRRRKA